MQDDRKAVWSIPYVSVSFFPSLKHNVFCILFFYSILTSRLHFWNSSAVTIRLSRVYSNCCCSCSFEPEIIKIDQSSHNMYSNNIVNFQESMTNLDACTKSQETFDLCKKYRNDDIHLFILNSYKHLEKKCLKVCKFSSNYSKFGLVWFLYFISYQPPGVI